MYQHDASHLYRTAELDSLRVDTDMQELQYLNDKADTDSLIDITVQAVDAAGDIRENDMVSALASLRDLDMLASSLLRHGIDPISEIDGLESAMLTFGNTADTIPRSTITTYAGANPDGQRRRSFTGSDQEEMFIAGLKESYIALDATTKVMAQARLLDGHERGLAYESLRMSSYAMDSMVRTIVSVYRGISAEYFTGTMRPYFEPLVLNGVSYSAAGGGQLPLLALEAMLSGVDDQDKGWRDFYSENYPYLSSEQRLGVSRFSQNNCGASMLTVAVEEASRGYPDTQLLAGVSEVMRKIRKFRYPHRKVADDNFNLRPPESVGSGSFTPSTLGALIARTETHIATLAGAVQ